MMMMQRSKYPNMCIKRVLNKGDFQLQNCGQKLSIHVATSYDKMLRSTMQYNLLVPVRGYVGLTATKYRNVSIRLMY